jgi:poly-beta-1,6-N-acetyl-D-glucosamine synthase
MSSMFLVNPVFTILVVLLFVFSFLLIWQFVGFPLVMGVVALRQKPKAKDYGFQPFVSIIVPTYNEDASIEPRIHNLYGLNYPPSNYEVIVVDSGSTDGTVPIVKRLAAERRDGEERCRINLVTEECRNGKATAINVGKRHARGDIVLVTDANSVFDQDVLKEVACHFKNETVGAVGGRYAVKNPGSLLTSSTQFYWDVEQIVRTGEAALDSACLFHGELNAWRKDLVDLDPTAISEDLDMCINIRKLGYKIEYEPDAVVYEPAPTTVKEQIRQRKRTSIGTIKSLSKNFNYLIRPMDLYRSLIVPSHKSLVMFSPFILIAIPLLYLFIQDARIILGHLAITGIAFVAIFMLLMRVRKLLLTDDRTKKSFSLVSGCKILYYVLLNEFIVLIAWKDLVVGNYSVLWEKAETTRIKGIQ